MDFSGFSVSPEKPLDRLARVFQGCSATALEFRFCLLAVRVAASAGLRGRQISGFDGSITFMDADKRNVFPEVSGKRQFAYRIFFPTANCFSVVTVVQEDNANAKAVMSSQISTAREH